MNLKARNKLSAEVNSAGMLDVIFLLLIFLIITRHDFIKDVIEVSEPSATKHVKQIPDMVVTIQQTTSGLKYFVNNGEVPLTSLKSSVKSELSKIGLGADKIPAVVVRSDKTVQLADAVKVVSLINEAGAKASFSVKMD